MSKNTHNISRTHSDFVYQTTRDTVEFDTQKKPLNLKTSELQLNGNQIALTDISNTSNLVQTDTNQTITGTKTHQARINTNEPLHITRFNTHYGIQRACNLQLTGNANDDQTLIYGEWHYNAGSTNDTLRYLVDVNDYFGRVQTYDWSNIVRTCITSDYPQRAGIGSFLRTLTIGQNYANTGPEALYINGNTFAVGNINIALGNTYQINGSPLSTTDIVEGNNLYFSDSRFDTGFNTKSTSDLTEGNNLYHTTARVQSVLDLDSSIVRTTDTQSIAGEKTFTDKFTANGYMIDDTGFGVASPYIINRSLHDANDHNSYAIVQTSLGNTLLNCKWGTDLTITNGNSSTVAVFKNSSVTLHKHTTIHGNCNVGGVYQINGTQMTTAHVPEGTNLYYTDARFDSRFSSKSTSNLAEGVNLYHTTPRVQSVIDSYTSIVRTSGDQTIGGTKTFSNAINNKLTLGNTATYGTALPVIANKEALDADSTAYALMQANTGTTYINCKSTQSVYIEVGASSVMTYTASLITAYKNMVVNGNMDITGEYRVNGEQITTSHVPEGTYLYHTTPRVQSVIDADPTIVKTTGNQSIAGIKTFTSDVVLEGNYPSMWLQPDNIGNNARLKIQHSRNNIYYDFCTDPAGGDIVYRLDGITEKLKFTANGDVDIKGDFKINGNVLSTTNLAEGSNLYHTTARVQSVIDADATLVRTNDTTVLRTNQTNTITAEHAYNDGKLVTNGLMKQRIGSVEYLVGASFIGYSIFNQNLSKNLLYFSPTDGKCSIGDAVMENGALTLVTSGNVSGTDNTPLKFISNGTHKVEMYWSDRGKYGEANGAGLSPHRNNSFTIEAYDNSESAGIFMNGNSMGCWNPADHQCFWFIDEDGLNNYYANSSYLSYISGTNGSLVTYSDRRLKDNIEDLYVPNICEEFLKLKPRTYTKKVLNQKSKDKPKYQTKQIGFIAQEVLETPFKSLVQNAEEGSTIMMGMDYEKMTVYLTQVCQTLIRRVDELEKIISQ